MFQSTVAPDAGSSADARGTAVRGGPFEAAQRDLFESVGLDARSRFVDLDRPDVRIHVFEAGPTAGPGAAEAGASNDAGPNAPNDDVPLLFVHGGGAFGAFLAPLVAEFDRDRVIGLDRPGYGLSGPFRYTTRNLRRTDVDVLAGVLDALDVDRVDVVGHSMGGYASVAFALDRPERVRRLVLVGACAGFPGASPPTKLRLLTVPGLNRVLLRVQKPGEAGVLDVAEIFGEREAIQGYPAAVRAMAAEAADPKSTSAMLSEFAAFFSVRGWHPTIALREAELRAIRQPTLVVWGERDPIGTPEDVRAGVEAIPDVRFEPVPAAHAPFLGDPVGCARLVAAFRADGSADRRPNAPGASSTERATSLRRSP